tara:strand:- start:934 stop:1128 length:195 start_codon:yes stop_codon:yes gene_type:complete
MFTEHLGKYAISNCLLSTLIMIMDDLWSEIQDMPGEIFDLAELEEEEAKLNVQLDELTNNNYTV